MPNYVKFLKYILIKKRGLGEIETVALVQECSHMLRNKIPQKLKDPRNFIISYSKKIRYCSKTLCDLKGSMYVMPLSVFKQLRVREVKPPMVMLQLADRFMSIQKARLKIY